MATPTAIVAYLALFGGIAAVFLFANLLIGKLVRPNLPNKEKLEVYECGEPVIGSSFVQFDLRFYVVALLFIIFDVEIAFFFPWATVFGKAAQMSSTDIPAATAGLEDGGGGLPAATVYRLEELGLSQEQIASSQSLEAAVGGTTATLQETAQTLAITSIADIAVFFAVLLVGFAYVWRRGDLDWVRATNAQRSPALDRPVPPVAPDERAKPVGSILSA